MHDKCRQKKIKRYNDVEEAGHELVVDLLVEQQSANTGASLSSCSDGSENNCRKSKVKVGIVHDQDGIVSSQLQDGSSESGVHNLADVASNLKLTVSQKN